MLLVIAILSILSGLAMTYIGGATEHSQSVVARQQQVQIQTALDAWITAQASGISGLAGARAAYSTDAAAMLTALAPYLRDPDIFSALGGGISSSALAGIGKTLRFSSWTDGSYPKVLMQ
jgi:type II secretory pathway pseudopilin PulG